MKKTLLPLAVVAAPVFGAASAFATPQLTARDGQFVLRLDDGRSLGSADLSGAVFDLPQPDGGTARLRLNAVQPDPDHPGRLLHDLAIETAPGQWQPFCDADAAGRRLALPIAGAWSPEGRFLRDPARFFISCTAGAQAKCLFFGYDPWKPGPGGQDLAPLYEACQHMVRAAYGGSAPHTTNGTTIDIFDDLGIQTPATLGDPTFAFEAGWTAAGATCLHHPRHPERSTPARLHQLYPDLAQGAACTAQSARAAGARLFSRSRPHPPDGL